MAMSRQSSTPILDDWKRAVGQYPGNDDSIKSSFDNLGVDDKRKLLGKREERTSMDSDGASSTKARDAFLTHLHQVLQTQPNSAYPTNLATVSMNKLLGAEGVKLYKAAIKEENNSHEFRKAVFNKSTKQYDGPQWAKKMVLWVGGPSASGKSFGTQGAVNEMAKIMPSNPTGPQGNKVVSVDGGIERELSQMRQMVLQVALSKGYKGVEDLHANTKLTVKKSVQDAALASKDLHVAIPETFTTGLRKKLMRKLNKDSNVVQAYSEVNAPKDQRRFRNSVALMGNTRAWNTQPFAETQIKMNNQNIGCESKVYEASNFKWGKAASAIAKSNYRKICKNPILISINHDLVYIKKDQAGNLKRCRADLDIDTPNKLLVTQSDLNNWQAYKNETPGKMQHPTLSATELGEKITALSQQLKQLDAKSPEALSLKTELSKLSLLDRMNHQKPEDKLDLKDWLTLCRKNDLLMPQKISVAQKKVSFQETATTTATADPLPQRAQSAPILSQSESAPSKPLPAIPSAGRRAQSAPALGAAAGPLPAKNAANNADEKSVDPVPTRQLTWMNAMPSRTVKPFLAPKPEENDKNRENPKPKSGL